MSSEPPIPSDPRAERVVRRVALACRWIDGVSGATTYILEKTRRFTAAGWEIHLYGERLDRDRIRDAGGVPHRIRLWPLGSGFKRWLFNCRFGRTAQGAGFDLIEGHGDILAQDVLLLHNCVHAAHEMIFGTPMPDNSLARLHARILQEKRFRLLIANSELMRRDLQSRYGIPAGKIKVIYPGYDPLRFRPEDRGVFREPMRRELGVRDEEILIGLATSGDFRKRGVDLFLRALGRLQPETLKKTRAVVLGKENRMHAYRETARELGLRSRVSFLPATPQVERFYHALDVFAYPAHFEEFGMSVQEAMACGVAVLTSVRVGAAELLGREGRDMLLDRPDDEGFARRLEDLIARPEMRRRWAEAGAAAVQGNTWDRNFQRTLEVYEGLLMTRLASA